MTNKIIITTIIEDHIAQHPTHSLITKPAPSDIPGDMSFRDDLVSHINTRTCIYMLTKYFVRS